MSRSSLREDRAGVQRIRPPRGERRRTGERGIEIIQDVQVIGNVADVADLRQHASTELPLDVEIPLRYGGILKVHGSGVTSEVEVAPPINAGTKPSRKVATAGTGF